MLRYLNTLTHMVPCNLLAAFEPGRELAIVLMSAQFQKQGVS